MFRIATLLLVPKILNYEAARAESMMQKVFVYGTLKRNEPNHNWLTNKDNGESCFLSTAATATKYPLVIATKYNIPFLLKDPGNGHYVKGEIYDVDEKMLGQLDILEDHPNYYQREMDDIKMDRAGQHETVRCWVYFLQKFKPELLKFPMMESYSSAGPHGKPYMESANESTVEDLDDIIKK